VPRSWWAFDRLAQRRKDSWEAVNKALYSLMVGHAAGLVGCLTLLKDYNATSPGHLKGLGAFIWLFGLGLYLAIVSASVWIFGRYNYWVFLQVRQAVRQKVYRETRARTKNESKVSGTSVPRHFQSKKCPFDGLENETNNSRRFIRSPRRRARAALAITQYREPWRFLD
jgi:hypothetical protein